MSPELLQASKSIESHINRQALSRLKKQYEQVIEEQKPGSGHNWKNKLTKPSLPKITGLETFTGRKASRPSLAAYLTNKPQNSC